METYTSTESAIPRAGGNLPSMQTSQANSLEASPPNSEAFMENPSLAACISGGTRCAGLFDKPAHTSMATLMPNISSAFTKPLSHHASMETLEEFPCHRAFLQTPIATRDCSANVAKSCTINVMMKKEEQSAPRKSCPVRRIENSNCEVTFCKRRNGFFNKAHELSVLCDAEVAAIIFSPAGKISEFASSSMSHSIKRYQSFQPQMLSNNVQLQGVERWRHTAMLLNSRSLQDFQRYIFEKNNTPLSINEIESMLVYALDKIRKRKVELFEMETHKALQKRETLLKERNSLQEKLMRILSTKDCVNNESNGWKDLCYDEDSVNTELQLGLDIV